MESCWEPEALTELAADTTRRAFPEPRPGLLALLWALGSLGLLALVLGQPQQRWTPPAPAEVVLEGQHYRLDAPQLEWLRAFSALHFSEGRAAARGLLEAELERGLDEAFLAVRARLPGFADWYYSLGGEYSRLGMAALARMNLAEGDYIARKAAAMLFPPEEWQEALAALDRRMLARLHAHQERVRAEWLARLGEQLAPYRVPTPLRAAGDGGRAAPVQLDGLVARLAAQEQQALEARFWQSTAAGGAVAGAVLWRQAAARAATATGRAVVARGAGRSAGAGGVAICAATGPAAPGCAVLAFVATWVAADWALLQIEELRNRDELLAALDAGLDRLQDQLLADVLAAYDAVSLEQQARATAVIAGEFRPAQAGRQAR